MDIQSSNCEESFTNDYNFVIDRKQEVKAHVGLVSYKGISDPIHLSQDLSGGCGGKIWECANIMIEYMIYKNQTMSGQLFENKTVVELGAGTGLVGLAVAKTCPNVKNVILTDQLSMMPLMQENIKLNNLSETVSAEILNWGETIQQDSELLNADVILASDCIYLEIAFLPLIETLFELSKNKEVVIYLTYCKRRKADKRFFSLAGKKFDFIDVKDDPKSCEYSKKSFHFYTVKRKEPKKQQQPNIKENASNTSNAV